MYELLMTVHILACLLLILFVLLQAGRGAGLAVFGGGGEAM
ncbi:MAG: preprotein translocase subunit SecG, partial [Elusimicrobiota bacterium]